METNQPDVPDLKAKDPNAKKEENKKGGLGWFSSAGKGAFSGAAGGSGAGGGGILAGLVSTKLGLLALVVGGIAATTGIGYVIQGALGGHGGKPGSHHVGVVPGTEARSGSVGFEAGTGAHGKRGDSLGYVATEPAGDSPSAEGVGQAGDQTAADGSGTTEDSAATAASDGSQTGAAGGSGAAGDSGTAQNSGAAPDSGSTNSPGRKAGGLSASISGSAGTSAPLASAAQSKTQVPQTQRASPGVGRLSRSNSAARTSANRSPGAARRRSGTMRQLAAVRRDQVGIHSSAEAGRTYEGGYRPAGGTIGPEGGTPSGGPGQGGGGGGDSNSSPNPEFGADPYDPDLNIPVTPPPPANVTPWQKAVDTAQKNLMYAAGILLIMSYAVPVIKNLPYPYGAIAKIIATIICIFAILMALAALYLGIRVAFGQFGQPAQGTIMMLGGGMTAILGALLIAAIWGSTGEDEVKEAMSSFRTLLLLCGAAVIAGGVWASNSGKKEIKSTDADYQKASEADCDNLDCG